MGTSHGRARSGYKKLGRGPRFKHTSTPDHPPRASESAFSDHRRFPSLAEGHGEWVIWKAHDHSFRVHRRVIGAYGNGARRRWLERLLYGDGYSWVEVNAADAWQGDPDGDQGAGVREPVPKPPDSLSGGARADVEADPDRFVPV